MEQLRQDDDIPLRLMLDRATNDAARLLEASEEESELATLLGRLACLAALLMQLEQKELLRLVVQELVHVYDLGFDANGQTRGGLKISSPRLWLAAIERVMGLGALAVRRKDWQSVRDLVLQKGAGEDFDADYYNNWVRHAVTMAHRAGLLGTPRGGGESVSLISESWKVVQETDCLHTGLEPGDERILNSLCQFDVLAAITAIGEARDTSDRNFYPSFSRFYSHRAAAVVEELLRDSKMRAVIFPLPDGELALALQAIDSLARSEGWRFAGWHGFPQSVQSFISENLPPDPGQ